MLQLKNVEARYGSFKALEQVSMSVAQGELVVLLGANGAGKSTLFNTISGLIKPSAGTITLDGTDVTGLKPSGLVQNGVVQCPEGRKLFPEMSVLKNLMLGAYLRDDRESIREDLSFVYDLFPILKERSTQDATTMSGGEQQMCAIGRGIMSKPRLLMIDELSLGLAPRLVDRLGDTLLEINKSGLTILLVEQDVMTAFEIAKRAFVIETGRVSISGSTAELGNDPKIKEAYMGI